MRNGQHPTDIMLHSNQWPIDAYQALAQTRDHLRLLAQLAEPQGDAGPDVIYLSAQALAHCFDRLADDLDRIAEAVGPLAP